MVQGMVCSNGGGNTLEYADYYADYAGANTALIPNDYDIVLVISSFEGDYSSYRPTYNGQVYDYKEGNKTNSTRGIVAVIPNVKANTNITFQNNLLFSVYGYNIV